MKRFYIAIMITICGLTAMAQDRPDMTHQTTGRDRGGLTIFTEFLQLQFNEDGLIEVMGSENEYFNVTITRETVCVWTGIIGREYGNVINYHDFSIVATYVITLTSSRGSTTVWRLENGVLNGSRIPRWGDVTDQIKNDYSRTFDR